MQSTGIRQVVVMLLCACVMVGTWASALPARAAVEVEHLLQFVRDSGCQFYRNGSWYEATGAADHLRSKYAYLLKRGQITTAEDFIRKAASYSSLSAEPYRVRCDGQAERTTGQWLTEELEVLRAHAR